MAEKLKCYLVSYNGVKNAGGVEKVCYYLQQIMIQKGFEVVIVDKGLIERSFLGQVYLQIFKKLHIVSFSFLASLFVANKRKNGDIKIAHGFNAPFFRTDYLFVHGTMKGYATAVGSVVGRSAKILFWLEKKACINAQKILSVSQNAIEEIKKFYTKRDLNFTVVNNGVDPTAFFLKKKMT
ncbi:glycosyltransferase [Niabella hibiscisoli]|uniref:glycosyltransferase n=1 Tax=Niabella hibiscisoli TaxID=1825928 RepID=UPI001F0D45E7|nr:glycosyltransferase [Niabella hibiscisoli]MCH5719954.1 glycosyltransferase [Niabella hibiscisoli]